MIGLICAGICLVAGAAFAKDETFSLKVGGHERSWLVHTPAGYDGKKPLPLVLALHGGGGNYQGIIESSQFSPKADKEGFIAVYPNGTGKLKGIGLTWNAGNGSGYALENKIDDVGFFRVLIEWLKNKYAVDPQRIFVTGLSNGGMMTYRLACELADVIAAAGIVSGALAVDSPAPARPVSAIVFHGTADEHILYNGGTPKKPLIIQSGTTSRFPSRSISG
jgi:polyhydroxybutyrate depolymerase